MGTRSRWTESGQGETSSWDLHEYEGQLREESPGLLNGWRRDWVWLILEDTPLQSPLRRGPETLVSWTVGMVTQTVDSNRLEWIWGIPTSSGERYSHLPPIRFER